MIKNQDRQILTEENMENHQINTTIKHKLKIMIKQKIPSITTIATMIKVAQGI